MATLIAALVALFSCAPKPQVRDAYDRFCGFVTDGRCAPFSDYKVEGGISDDGVARYNFFRPDALTTSGRREVVDAFGCMYTQTRIVCMREDRNDDPRQGPPYDVPRPR